MATHYVWADGTALGGKLRDGLTHYRMAKYELEWALNAMQQMTDAEIVTVFGFVAGTIAGVSSTALQMAAAAKAELAADVGRLSNDASQSSFAAALAQMLAQFA